MNNGRANLQKHAESYIKFKPYFNNMTIEVKQILDELKTIKVDLDFIKKHMFDPDTILTTEETKRFEQSMKELKEGKTTSLSAIKKELGL